MRNIFGENAFRMCEHKDIDLTYHSKSGLPWRATLNCPRTEDLGEPVVVVDEGARIWHQYRRTVRGVYGYGYYNEGFKSSAVAVDYLKKNAGKIACAGCPYPNASVVEVAEIKAGAADQELRAAEIGLEASQKRMQALEARQETARLDAITSGTMPVEQI